METLNDSEIEKQFEQFGKTFADSPEERQKAEQIINYIIRQFNNHSLRGFIGYEEFRTVVRNAAKGMFYLIFLNQFEFPEEAAARIAASNKKNMLLNLPPEALQIYMDDAEIIKAKTIYKSSFNLMYLLMTRVYEGKDYKLIMAEIESRKPMLLQQK